MLRIILDGTERKEASLSKANIVQMQLYCLIGCEGIS